MCVGYPLRLCRMALKTSSSKFYFEWTHSSSRIYEKHGDLLIWESMGAENRNCHFSVKSLQFLRFITPPYTTNKEEAFAEYCAYRPKDLAVMVKPSGGLDHHPAILFHYKRMEAETVVVMWFFWASISLGSLTHDGKDITVTAIMAFSQS